MGLINSISAPELCKLAFIESWKEIFELVGNIFIQIVCFAFARKIFGSGTKREHLNNSVDKV